MQLRQDVRVLRREKARLSRAHQEQDRLKDQQRRIRDLERENERLTREMDQVSKTKKRYQVALFDHGNFRHRREQSKKKRGGQPGHADTNREAHQGPPTGEPKRLFASVCGRCGKSLPRVQTTRRKELLDSVLHPPSPQAGDRE